MDFTSLKEALSAWQAALPDGSAVSMSLLDQYAAQAEALRDQQAALTDLQSASLELHAALENISRTLYGNYSGALNIYNLPTSLMAAVTAAVIPAVSGALARRDRRGAGRITGSAPADLRPGRLSHGGGPLRPGRAHHGSHFPQPEPPAGRSPAVHPGPGHPCSCA